MPAHSRKVMDGLEHAQQFAHTTDEQSLLLDVHPGSGGVREDDMVTGAHRHLQADVSPPVHSGAYGEHDAVLGRRFVGPGRDDQARQTDPVRLKLLDDHAVEERSQLLAHSAELRSLTTS